MKIYDGLREVADKFEIFLFDAYGVFWEGSKFYEGSRELMAQLVSEGKIVVVISNTTKLCAEMVASYEQKGLLIGRDYSYMITSGELLRKNLSEQKITFNSCENPRKYFVIGKPHDKAFAGTIYQQVNSLVEADFVYCGVPFMTAEEVKKYPQYAKEYYPVSVDDNGNYVLWDTLVCEPFADVVKQVAELKLPALNANPDFTAKEGHKLWPQTPSVFVVRNGSIAEMLRQSGCEVSEYGKPHKNIYDYTFAMLENNGVNISDKTKICMIGDTVRTDIKGAVAAGITPILCVNTGVTAEEISKGKTVESLCEKENIDVKQIIQIKSVGGK